MICNKTGTKSFAAYTTILSINRNKGVLGNDYADTKLSA